MNAKKPIFALKISDYSDMINSNKKPPHISVMVL